MKLITFALTILICTNTKAQLLKDTLYINKDENKIIFIDKPHSYFHDLVFKFLMPDSNHLKYTNHNICIVDNLKLNYLGDWITIKKFKNKFYAYYPSEPFYNTYIQLSDSALLINDFNEGFISYTVTNKREAIKKLKIELISYDGKRHTLSMRQKPSKIFIIKSTLFNANKLFFVQRHVYYNFPIIVNYCPTNRCQEFNFK